MARFEVGKTFHDGGCSATIATWPNGMRCIVFHGTGMHTSVVQFHFINGACHYRYGWGGLPHMCEHLVLTSIKGMSQVRFAQQIDRLGDVNGYTDDNMVGLGCEGLPGSWRPTLRFFGRVLSDYARGRIDERAVRTQRAQIIQEIRELDNLSGLSSILFYSSLFPNSVYGQPATGNVSQIRKFKTADIVGCFRRFMSGNRLLIGVSGNVRPRTVFREVHGLFGALPAGDPPETEPLPATSCGGIHLRVNNAYKQVGFVFGQRLQRKRGAPSHCDTEEVSEIFRHVLGGLYSSETYLSACQSGACYDFQASIASFSDESVLQLSALCDPLKLNELLESYLSTLHRIARRGVTETEFDLAMHQVLCSTAYYAARPRSRSYWALRSLSETDKYLPYRQRVRAFGRVTRRNIQEFAKGYLNTRRFLLAAVGPLEGFEASAKVQHACGL